MARGAGQDRFLGSLMGMAIGDAMGMPVAGWPAARIAERYGTLDAFFPKVFPDGGEIKAGEFTDESELALCIVESFTVNNGELDVDNIGARFLYLARGEAKRWIAPDTLDAILAAEASLEFQVAVDEDGPATGDVAARGIPVGLIHSVGPLDPDRLRSDAEAVTRVTHGSPAAAKSVAAVAFALQSAARGEDPQAWAATTADFLGSGATAEALRAVQKALEAGAKTRELVQDDSASAAAVVATAIGVAATASDFTEAIFGAVNAGGATDSRGAIAGALAGARWGISAIPQRMIDELEGRIYVSLAVPWFYRSALRRAGLLLDLKQRD